MSAPADWLRALCLEHGVVVEEPAPGQYWRGWRLRGIALNPTYADRFAAYRVARLGFGLLPRQLKKPLQTRLFVRHKIPKAAMGNGLTHSEFSRRGGSVKSSSKIRCSSAQLWTKRKCAARNLPRRSSRGTLKKSQSA